MAENALTTFDADYDKFATRALTKTLAPAEIERLKRVAMLALQQEPGLLKASKKSLFLALEQCANDGLMPDKRLAALVMFGTEAVYMPMVAGVIARLRGSGAVDAIRAVLVHENDDITVHEGYRNEIEHRPNPFDKDRGEVVGVYAVAKLPNGEFEHEILTLEDLAAIRKKSRSKGGPWTEFFGEMAKKSAIRRLAKRLSLPDDVRAVVERDDQLYDLDLRADSTPAREAVSRLAPLADGGDVSPDAVVEEGEAGADLSAQAHRDKISAETDSDDEEVA